MPLYPKGHRHLLFWSAVLFFSMLAIMLCLPGCADSGGRNGPNDFDLHPLYGIKVWIPRNLPQAERQLLAESISYQEDYLRRFYPPATFEVVLVESNRGLSHQGPVAFDLSLNRVYVWIGRQSAAEGYAHARIHWSFLPPAGFGPGDLAHLDVNWPFHSAVAANAVAGVLANR